METKRYSLKQVLKIGNGKDHSCLQDGVFPVYGSGGLMRYADSYLYEGESVLLPRKGTLSNIQYVKGAFWTVDTCYYTKIDENIVEPYYLYRLLNSMDLSGLDSGASIPSMTSKTYYGIKISIPELIIQKRISEYLKQYDSLIELNNKRIKLLEQMAENLYKEWFVRFRFPGHETAEFENGIPKGWTVEKLGKHVKINRGGSPRPIQDYISDSGYRWLKISDATASNSPFVFDIKEHIIESGLNKTVLIKSGNLVLSNSATPGIPKILCVDSCIHDGWLYFQDSHFSNEFLYLLFEFERPNIASLGNGAVFTNLKTDILKNYSVIVPDSVILDKFQVIIKPIFDAIYSFGKMNGNLTKQRDSLLPRLMSGKLEVF